MTTKQNRSPGSWWSNRSCFSAKGRRVGIVAPRGKAWFTSLGHCVCWWETTPDPTHRPPTQTIDLSSKGEVPWGKWKWFSVWILTAGEWFLNSSPAPGPTWTQNQISVICAGEGAGIHTFPVAAPLGGGEKRGPGMGLLRAKAWEGTLRAMCFTDGELSPYYSVICFFPLNKLFLLFIFIF